MARHEALTQRTGVKVYFADPHSPWQRGINENTNGLLRQYLPKGEDLSLFSQEQLDAIAWRLNTRPRKSLGFKCPAELFTQMHLILGSIMLRFLHFNLETALLKKYYILYK